MNLDEVLTDTRQLKNVYDNACERCYCRKSGYADEPNRIEDQCDHEFCICHSEPINEDTACHECGRRHVPLTGSWCQSCQNAYFDRLEGLR